MEEFVSVIYCHITNCPKLSGFLLLTGNLTWLNRRHSPHLPGAPLCIWPQPLISRRSASGLWLVISWENRVSRSSSQKPARCVLDFQKEHQHTSIFPASVASQVQLVVEELSSARENPRCEQIGDSPVAVSATELKAAWWCARSARLGD